MADIVYIRLLRVEGLKEEEVLDLEVEMSHEACIALRSGAMPYFVHLGKQYEFYAIDMSEGNKVVLEFVPVRH
ncbi:MAG: hypothetical protein Q7R71_02325 [bacterium]|nr:hypothetical protein [bacterium]